ELPQSELERTFVRGAQSQGLQQHDYIIDLAEPCRQPLGCGLRASLAMPRSRAQPHYKIGKPRLSVAIHGYTPVDPKPPCPRCVSASMSVSSKFAWMRSTTRSCAMRWPGAMLCGSDPRFVMITFNSPR